MRREEDVRHRDLERKVHMSFEPPKQHCGGHSSPQKSLCPTDPALRCGHTRERSLQPHRQDSFDSNHVGCYCDDFFQIV